MTVLYYMKLAIDDNNLRETSVGYVHDLNCLKVAEVWEMKYYVIK